MYRYSYYDSLQPACSFFVDFSQFGVVVFSLYPLHLYCSVCEFDCVVLSFITLAVVLQFLVIILREIRWHGVQRMFSSDMPRDCCLGLSQ